MPTLRWTGEEPRRAREGDAAYCKNFCTQRTIVKNDGPNHDEKGAGTKRTEEPRTRTAHVDALRRCNRGAHVVFFGKVLSHTRQGEFGTIVMVDGTTNLIKVIPMPSKATPKDAAVAVKPLIHPMIRNKVANAATENFRPWQPWTKSQIVAASDQVRALTTRSLNNASGNYGITAHPRA